MEPRITALIIYNRDDRLQTLRDVLPALPAKVMRARNCREAAAYLCAPDPPELVLTDSVLPDCNWQDVLDLSAKAMEKVSVIVVSTVANAKLYSDVVNAGALDFITDSFTVVELVQVLKSARDLALRRRQQELGLRSSREIDRRRAEA